MEVIGVFSNGLAVFQLSRCYGGGSSGAAQLLSTQKSETKYYIFQ